ncbi:hypothetical protein LIER_08241 [Lithospermum erythrorhizon]|uniref:Uncharacterized protein n=1 Tax=Lithospermum erythrorhizon TaxID=34254 RepID=A0AAV3PCU5_LITER
MAGGSAWAGTLKVTLSASKAPRMWRRKSYPPCAWQFSEVPLVLRMGYKLKKNTLGQTLAFDVKEGRPSGFWLHLGYEGLAETLHLRFYCEIKKVVLREFTATTINVDFHCLSLRRATRGERGLRVKGGWREGAQRNHSQPGPLKRRKPGG